MIKVFLYILVVLAKGLLHMKGELQIGGLNKCSIFFCITSESSLLKVLCQQVGFLEGVLSTYMC